MPAPDPSPPDEPVCPACSGTLMVFRRLPELDVFGQMRYLQPCPSCTTPGARSPEGDSTRLARVDSETTQ